MNAPVTPECILQLGLAFWGSKTLLSAIELKVFTELAAGPLDGPALRERLGLHPRSARDFFDALVALKMLERDAEGRYSNTAETGLFLDKNKPSYVGGLLEMANMRLFQHWGSLTEGLQTGLPQNEIKGGVEGNPFDKLYGDPVLLENFLAGMTGVSLGAAIAIAQKFPWGEYKSFVDLGTAQGALVAQILLAHPHLTGGGFDLPPVGPVFEKYIASLNLAPRAKFYEGDFFNDALPPADVYVMGHILHDWDLETKQMLLKKVYDSLPQGGAVIVYEALIDDDRRENAFGLLMSLNMLIETPGGFDYTGADCRGWMQQAGFRETRVEHLVGPDSMVIGVR